MYTQLTGGTRRRLHFDYSNREGLTCYTYWYILLLMLRILGAMHTFVNDSNRKGRTQVAMHLLSNYEFQKVSSNIPRTFAADYSSA